MMWYVTTSLSCCGATLVAVLGLLALTAYYVSDGDRSIPSDTGDDWMLHVIILVAVSVVFVFFCVLTACTLCAKKKKKCCFILVLLANLLCLGGSLYFAAAFKLQHDADPIVADALFNSTKTKIEDHTDSDKKNWIPPWLDSIQKNSKDCCGIRTFRDWEEFWPGNENEIPKSCCKDPDVADKCPSFLGRLAFPDTPSDFIKEDSGCIGEINDFIQKNAQDCFIYMLIVSVLFAACQVAYFSQYYIQYISGRVEAGDVGGGDVGAGTKRRGFLGFGWGKNNAADNVEAGAATNGTCPGGDVNNADMAGSLLDYSNNSGFSSQATLPTVQGQNPAVSNVQIVSSDSDMDAGSNQPTGTFQGMVDKIGSCLGKVPNKVTDTLGSLEKKIKKRKKRKSKPQQDDMTGSDGTDGVVNRQEVFMIPDTSSSRNRNPAATNSIPTGSSINSYDNLNPNQSDDLASSTGAFSPTVASASASNDEVGDKLADDAKKDKKQRVFGNRNKKK